MHYFTFFKHFIVCLIFVLLGCEAQDPERYIAEGKVFFAQGELENARVQFQNALQLNPELAEAYYSLALVAEQQQNWGRMIRNLADTVTIDPVHLPAQIRLGQFYLLGGEYDKAAKQVQIILAVNPQNITAQLMQAAIDLKQENNTEAIKKIEQVLAKKPYFSAAIALKVTYLTIEKRKTEALKILNEGVQHNPGDRDLRLLKIRLDVDSKQFDKAISEYHYLLDKYPEQDSLRFSLVDLLLSLDRQNGAEQLLQQVILKQAGNIALKLKLVELIKQRAPKQAEKLLKKYMANSAESVELKFQLAEMYISDARTEAAENILQQIISESVNSATTLAAKVKIAHIALQQDEKLKARLLLAEVLAEDANYSDALLLRAGLRLKMRDAEGAIADLRIVHANRPSSEQVLSLQAQAYVLKGEKEVAESYWRKVLAVNPSNIIAITQLTKALIIRKDYVQAENLLAKAMENNPENISITEFLIQLGVVKKDWQGVDKAIARLKQQEKGVLPAVMWSARMAERQQQYDKAIRLYKGLLNKTPDNRTVLYHALALAYIESKQWVEAEQLLKQQIRGMPTDIYAYFLLVRVYQNLNKPLATEQTYLAGLNVFEGNLPLMNELAKFYIVQKDYAKSINIYKKIIEKYPNNNAIANNLADLLITYQGGDSKSTKLAQKLVLRFKNSPNAIIQDTYGWVQLKRGHTKEALKALKKSVRSIPNNARVLYHLAEAYQQARDTKNASIELEKSFALIKEQGEYIEIARAKALRNQLIGENN